MALGLLLPGSVSARTWYEPVQISESGVFSRSPQIAVDPRGDAVAVWQRSGPTETVIQAAVRPAGGSWQSPVRISAAGQTASAPRVAIDGQGQSIAVWTLHDHSRNVVQAAIKPAHSGWLPATRLSEAGQNAEEPQLAVDAPGDAIAVWTQPGATSSLAEASTRPAGGTWRSAIAVSEAGLLASEPHAAINRKGEAVAIWKSEAVTESAPVVGSVQSATRPSGGAWQAPVDLTGGGFNLEHLEGGGPLIALDGGGDALSLWAGLEEFSSIWLESAARPASGEWQPTLRLTKKRSHSISLAIDGAGDAIGAWEEGPSAFALAAIRPAGGEWQPGEPVAPEGCGCDENPQVAMNEHGDAVLVWEAENSGQVHASSRPAGGAWSPEADISAGSDSLEGGHPIAVAGGGEALAVWTAPGGVIQSATYR